MNLIERLTNGSGPDRELDARIAIHFGVIKENIRDGRFSYWCEDQTSHKGWRMMVCGPVTEGREPIEALSGLIPVITPTSSLDDCIALVQKALPGWWWGCGLCQLTGDGDVGPQAYGSTGPDFRDARCSPEIVEKFDEGFSTSLAADDGVSSVCRALLISIIQAHDALNNHRSQDNEPD